MKSKLAALIQSAGPLSVAQYMAATLYDPQDGYYATRPGLGSDFVTAPEVSQMFGELLGAWIVHEWERIGRPAPVHVIELGPGTGALMADVWRCVRTVPACAAAARLHMVEVSAPLIDRQTQALNAVGAVGHHHARLEDVPAGPTLLLANEYLDCLPIRQFVRTEKGWCERLVGVADSALAFGLSQGTLADDAVIAPSLRKAPIGSVVEIAPALPAVIAAIAARLKAAPGCALLIDYGSDEPSLGDTLQAVRAHKKESPLANPGRADLTAHVDFAAVRACAAHEGVVAFGPLPQGAFLSRLGLHQRAAQLAAHHPDRVDRLAREVERLAGPEQMGVLFKVLCLTTPDLSPPAGFSPT